MSGEISSSNEPAQTVANLVSGGLEGYSAFEVEKVYPYANVLGNQIHDVAVGEAIADALDIWRDVVESDATALVQEAGNLSGIDEEAAVKILGISSRRTLSLTVTRCGKW